MALLGRLDWYNLARTTNWTPGSVTEDELFPPDMSGSMGIPLSKWESYDEPYKQTYPEYVKVQREKDAGAYSVKAALERSEIYEKADPGWQAVLKLHYGAFPRAEYSASTAEARMARFGKAPGMRNMATMGMLDEMRHAQLQLYFPHELCPKDRQFDWAHKSGDTNHWAIVAARHLFDDMMVTRGASEVALGLTFAFETGFTNMQFLGLASDAAEVGDWSFSNMISSIQTDESRHAQIGGPLVAILLENGKKEEAQRIVDMMIWRAWKLFSAVTGAAMDYFTPVADRKMSFKEFMLEWIVSQFERALLDLGLDKPWYWDQLVADLDHASHAMQMGFWFWRPIMWWNNPAGVTAEDRAWLEEKYPGWSESFGTVWDVITDNLLEGKKERTYPETLPMLCNMCQLPIASVPGPAWKVRDFPLEYKGRSYHFCSEGCQWCFEQETERYAGHLSLIDRFLAGHIQPPNLEGALNYMSLAPGEIGDDAHNYAWVETIRAARQKAAA